MLLLRSVLPGLAVLLVSTATVEAQVAAVVYIVRHAEEASTGDDPGLTLSGRTRAESLARMLADEEIAVVLSTAHARSRETAAAVARSHGIDVELYDAGTPDDLIRRISRAPGRYLVVGDARTVPGLVRMFGWDPRSAIAAGEYDRLYIVASLYGCSDPPSRGRNLATMLRYGEPSRTP